MDYLDLIKPYLTRQEFHKLRHVAGKYPPFLIVCSLCYFFRCCDDIPIEKKTLFICCLSLTTKYHSDFGIKKGLLPWSKRYEIPLIVLHACEQDLIKFLNYKLHVPYEEIMRLKKLYSYFKNEQIVLTLASRVEGIKINA